MEELFHTFFRFLHKIFLGGMKLDKRREQQVWNRVYGKQPQQDPRWRQEAERALRRSEANVRFYEKAQSDPIYAEAFAHLLCQTREHCKMLRRILGGCRG